MTDIHLDISNLSHFYGPNPSEGLTLNSINLSLIKGELLGLLGPSFLYVDFFCSKIILFAEFQFHLLAQIFQY